MHVLSLSLSHTYAHTHTLMSYRICPLYSHVTGSSEEEEDEIFVLDPSALTVQDMQVAPLSFFLFSFLIFPFPLHSFSSILFSSPFISLISLPPFPSLYLYFLPYFHLYLYFLPYFHLYLYFLPYFHLYLYFLPYFHLYLTISLFGPIPAPCPLPHQNISSCAYLFSLHTSECR